MKNTRSIAILGGMGPQASAKLVQVLIDMAARDFGAKSDPDFPEIILDSVPVPNFVSSEKNIKTTLAMLKKRVKSLENFNPSCFSIACNTAHIMISDLQAVTKIPFVSIVEEVAKRVDEAQISRVALLGTPVTVKSAMYQNALENRAINVILPTQSEQKIVEVIIWNVLASKITKTDREKLAKICKSLRTQGAQGVILGCTELPLIFPKNVGMPIFDSIEILARALLLSVFRQV